MTACVLVHGGAHGAWCWERLTPHLRASAAIGQVVAVDLLEDALALAAKPLQEVTLEDYVAGLVARIERLDLEDILLVGHSMAGITVPAVAHRIPRRIRRVIYLSSSNPPVGQSVADLMAHPLSPLSRGLEFRQTFCNDLDEADTQWLLGNLREDPVAPFNTAVDHCALPPGIPATYVVLDRDEALPPAFQLEQARNARVDEVRHFDAGHSAFVSRPADLARLLLEYV